MGKQAGNHVVLAVIIEHVGHVATLLQQVTAAGQVVGPCLGHLGPGLMAVEPLAIDHQPQSRFLVIDGLVGALVDDKAVGAAGHLEVGCRLQVAGIVAIGTATHAVGSQRLGGDKRLAVEVGYRGRLADVALGHTGIGVIGFDPLGNRPHGSHGNVGLSLDAHAVGQVESAVLVGLKVGLHAVFMGNARRVLIHALLNQLADGRSPVIEELFALLGRTDDFACQYGQPWHQAVAASLFKLLRHQGTPGFPSGFIAVNQQIMESAFAHQAACRFLIGVEVILQKVGKGLFVDFTHLQSGRLGRCGMVLLAREGVAEPIDFPITLGGFPRQDTIVIDTVGDVDDIGQPDGLTRLGGREEVHHVRRRCKARFLFGVVDSGRGV